MNPLSAFLDLKPEMRMLRMSAAFMLAVFLLETTRAHSGACAPSQSSKLAGYVANKYELAPDVSVQDDGVVGATCFRRLTFQARAPRKSLVLYLSPGQEFLTPELLDVAVDPTAERERVARETQRDLLAEESPTKGPASASVTIVEFSDFQCLYAGGGTVLDHLL